MKNLALILAMSAAALCHGAESLLSIPVRTIEGKESTLKEYAGKVLLIVNVASECGYTGQYAGLQALHQKYAGQGLAVLGFPCNDFGGQEPGSEEDIRSFCTSRYQVSFPMFSKVRLQGAGKHPLFAALTQSGEVNWNFEKFLIGKDGQLISRFDSSAEPESGEVEEAVKRALAK